MVLEESGQSDPENVETRIWRTSLPVIHLCAAVQYFMKTLERSGKPIRDFTDILSNRLYIECIISTAKDFEPLLASSKLKINPGTLLNVTSIKLIFNN